MGAPLRNAVVYLLRMRCPWRAEQAAALAGVTLARARAYVTELTREHIRALVVGPDGAITPGTYARRWIALEPKTEPGGNAIAYRRARAVRAELEAADWQAGRGPAPAQAGPQAAECCSAPSAVTPNCRSCASEAGNANAEGGSRSLTSGSAPVVDTVQQPAMNPATDAMLTLRQAAIQLQMHPHTVRRYVHDGLLKAVRVGPHEIRIPSAEIARVLTPVVPRRA